MTNCAGIILAAGAGTRFGSRKQIAEIRGKPVVQYAIDAIESIDRVGDIVLVLGAHAEDVLEAACVRRARVVIAERWCEGMGASLAAGLSAAGDCDAAVVVLGDQPAITPQAIDRVLDARDAKLVAARATYGGKPGHPVVLERILFPELRRLTGDAGARVVLGRPDVGLVPCDDIADPRDIDTRDDLEGWRPR